MVSYWNFLFLPLFPNITIKNVKRSLTFLHDNLSKNLMH